MAIAVLCVQERELNMGYLLRCPNYQITSSIWSMATVQQTVVCSRPLCTYCGIFSPKKNGFSEKKNSSQKKNFFFTFFLCNFSVRTLQCFQKIFFFFFAHKKLKKPPSKVAHNRPKHFIPQPSPSHSQQPKIDFSCHKNVPPSLCLLLCDLTSMKHIKFYVVQVASKYDKI